MILLSEADKSVLYGYASVLESLPVDLYAIGGTLLGAVRGGDLIKWDDDLDYMVLEHDTGTFEACVRTLNERGFMFFKESSPKYTTVYHITQPVCLDALVRGMIHVTNVEWARVLGGKTLRFRARNDLAADIFIYVPCRHGPGEPKSYNLLCNPRKTHQVTADDLAAAKKYTLGPVSITSFANAEAFLERVFGKMWRVEKCTHQHRGAIARYRFA
jgi:hypothetical protein